MCFKILISTSLCVKQLCILFTNVIHFKITRYIKLEKVDRDKDFVSQREVYIRVDLQ